MKIRDYKRCKSYNVLVKNKKGKRKKVSMLSKYKERVIVLMEKNDEI
jgi:hypothetical protein